MRFQAASGENNPSPEIAPGYFCQVCEKRVMGCPDDTLAKLKRHVYVPSVNVILKGYPLFGKIPGVTRLLIMIEL